MKPDPLPPAVAALRKRYPDADDDERVLRFMYAGTQVDDMLAAGPMNLDYQFEAPLTRLVRGLADRKFSRIFVGAA